MKKTCSTCLTEMKGFTLHKDCRTCRQQWKAFYNGKTDVSPMMRAIAWEQQDGIRSREDND